MITLKPYPIIINGNRRDDLLYELWQLGGSKPAEKPGNLDEIELRDSVGPETEHYERTVQGCLHRIGRYKSGRCVLAASLGLAEPFQILPLGERDKAIRFDHFWLNSCPGANAYTRQAGPGQKTTRVLFTPYAADSCDTKLNIGSPDVTLLHELVHAVRPAVGRNLMAKTTNDAWVNLEEFFAVVVENIYRSERGDKVLRGGWDQSQLAGSAATSTAFLADRTLRARIEEALKREDLARKLARLSEIPFNPFAAVAKA
jgi:hypothetical protein